MLNNQLITIWDSFPKINRFLKNIHLLLMISILYSSVSLMSQKLTSYKIWNFSVFVLIILHGVYIRLSNYSQPGNQISLLCLYTFLSLITKIVAISGNIIIPMGLNSTELKTHIILNIILFNIYAFYDIFHLFISAVLFKLVSSEIIMLNPEIIEKCLNHSEIVDYETKYENTICSICLEDITNLIGIRKTECNHIFHNDCVLPWFKIQNNCPVCRFVFD